MIKFLKRMLFKLGYLYCLNCKWKNQCPIHKYDKYDFCFLKDK